MEPPPPAAPGQPPSGQQPSGLPPFGAYYHAAPSPGAPPPPGMPYLPPPQPPAPRRNGRVIAVVAGVLSGVVLLCGGAVAVGALVVQRAGLLGEGSAEAAGGAGGPTLPPVPGGPVLWLAEEPAAGLDWPPWREVAEEFSAAQGQEVMLREVDRMDYRWDLSDRLRAGDPPDLYHSPGGNPLRRQVEAGLVRDLTDDLAEVIATLSPAVLAPYTVDGRVYGLPYHMDVVGVWYNKALFAEAGLDPERPPETWGDFLAAVAALTDADISPIAVSEWSLPRWFGYLITRVAGTDALAEAGAERSLLHNPDFLRATELLEEFFRAEPFQQDFTFEESDVLLTADLMRDGEAAMELAYQGAHVTYQNFAGGDDIGDDLGWFPFPAVERGVGTIADFYGGGEGIVVGAAAPDAALDLLRYTFSDEHYQRMLPPSGISVRQDATASVRGTFEDQHLRVVQQAPSMQLHLEADLPQDVGFDLRHGVESLYHGERTPEQLIAQITDSWQAADDY